MLVYVDEDNRCFSCVVIHIYSHLQCEEDILWPKCPDLPAPSSARKTSKDTCGKVLTSLAKLYRQRQAEAGRRGLGFGSRRWLFASRGPRQALFVRLKQICRIGGSSIRSQDL